LLCDASARFQTNLICAAFYLAVLFGLKTIAVTLYPLAFALGTFLTVAYYGLDHFNLEQAKRRRAWERLYPWVHFSAHGEHALALPLTLLYACVGRDRALALPSTGDVALYVGGYMAFYLTLTHVNKWATGMWIYPVFDDVTKAGGATGRVAFLAVLCGVIISFAFVGRAIAEARTLCFFEVGSYTYITEWACEKGI